MVTNNREDYMLNKFKYKDWTFVEYINPKNIMDTSRSYPHDAIYRSRPNDKQVYERLINWFKHYEQDLPDADEVWDALNEEEVSGIFRDSKKEFSRWWQSLSTKLKHYYTDRLESGKPLMPQGDLDGLDGPISRGAIQMTLINDRLALSSIDVKVLDKAKSMIEQVKGSMSFEHRTTKNNRGEEIHTYIFDLK